MSADIKTKHRGVEITDARQIETALNRLRPRPPLRPSFQLAVEFVVVLPPASSGGIPHQETQQAVGDLQLSESACVGRRRDRVELESSEAGPHSSAPRAIPLQCGDSAGEEKCFDRNDTEGGGQRR